MTRYELKNKFSSRDRRTNVAAGIVAAPRSGAGLAGSARSIADSPTRACILPRDENMNEGAAQRNDEERMTKYEWNAVHGPLRSI
jgi:hypothetical protein